MNVVPAEVVEQRVVTGVKVTLTREEAATLLALFAHVGGHPTTTRRGVIEELQAELGKAGMVAAKHCICPDNHSVYFVEDGKGR